MHKLLPLFLIALMGGAVLYSITKNGSNFSPLTDASTLTTRYATPTPLGNCTRCDPNDPNKTRLCYRSAAGITNCRPGGFCLDNRICVQASNCVAFCVPPTLATPSSGKCTRCSPTDSSSSLICDLTNGQAVNCKPSGHCLGNDKCAQMSNCVAICKP